MSITQIVTLLSIISVTAKEFSSLAKIILAGLVTIQYHLLGSTFRVGQVDLSNFSKIQNYC